jgi:hypothetical protein
MARIRCCAQCSLQEAFYASEFKSNLAINSSNPEITYTTGCEAGTGNGDTIMLPPGAVFTFDHSWDQDSHNYMGPTATPIVFSKIIIEGNGATLQWLDHGGAAPVNSRLFAIGPDLTTDPNASAKGDVTLKNVYVKGFHVKGGDGGFGGGGGGLGAGGAIYNFGGVLTIENSTFENNGAVGGNGGDGTSDNGGGAGGGGLAGNGGAGCGRSGGGGGGSRGDGGKGGASSRTPAALLPAALMGLEAAAAEQVSLERKGSRALVSRVVSVGFAAAGMVGILMEAMAAKQPVREAAVVLVAVESTTRCVSLLLHVAGMAAGGPSAVVAVAA